MGLVVAIGNDVANVKEGDRVVVPFTISCGGCFLTKLLDYFFIDVIDPTFLTAHRMPLEKASEMNRIFQDKKDGCIKVVLRP